MLNLIMNYGNPVVIGTDGSTDVIEFLGMQIWNSADNCREYADEESDLREGLKHFLIKEITKWWKFLKIPNYGNLDDENCSSYNIQ